MTTRNTIPKGNGAPLTPLVNSLIRTKLSYLHQQEAFVLRVYEDLQQIDPTDLNVNSRQSRLRLIKDRLDEFIGRLEQLEHAQKMLCLIRSFIDESTALAIYELLANDKYLYYSEQNLRSLLGVEGLLYGSVGLSEN